MNLSLRFELAAGSDFDLAQQRDSHRRWLFWLAVIWIVLTDEAREREREHKRRLAAQQVRNWREEERRQRRVRRAPKPPTP